MKLFKYIINGIVVLSLSIGVVFALDTAPDLEELKSLCNQGCDTYNNNTAGGYINGVQTNGITSYGPNGGEGSIVVGGGSATCHCN